MNREDFITQVYCIVDDFFQQITAKKPIRKRGPAPALDDSEVIAMLIAGEFFGMDGDKNIWAYFKNNWSHLFTKIGDRSAFARQASNLWYWLQRLQKAIVKFLHADDDKLYITDGFPMPVTNFSRAHFSKVHKGDASFGYCASKKMTYYGFKGHLVTNSEGIVCRYTFAAANVDERDILPENSVGLSGFIFGDKGLIRPELTEDLAKHGIKLEHPLRSNMKESRPKVYLKAMLKKRRLIETVIGQLADRFNIEKVRARRQISLIARFSRKILAHTVGILMNKMAGKPSLQFENLVA